MSGTLLTTTSKGETAKAGKIAKPGTYKMTINMMDYTYSIEQLASEYYLVGKLQDWEAEPKGKSVSCMQNQLWFRAIQLNGIVMQT